MGISAFVTETSSIYADLAYMDDEEEKDKDKCNHEHISSRKTEKKKVN